MNVIVANNNRDLFSNIDVDIIKSISGEFSSEEIVQTFSNFFFNKMFLDITAITNYSNLQNLKKISIGLDVSKIILYIGNDMDTNSNAYISGLISMGFYNFAKNLDEIKYLYNNPNSYKDVAHLQSDDSIIISNNTSSDDSLNMMSQISNNNYIEDDDVRIIGFKDFTSHAGATSLIYMLKKQLSKNYYTVCIEVNKSDFLFFKDTDMVSCRVDNLRNTISKYKDANIILVDLNDLDDSISLNVCSDVIYLIEPSILSINKIAMLNMKSFDKLRNFKVVLNDCLLSHRDVITFGKEAGINVFYSLPPMNDREDNSEVLFPFLEKLNLYRKVDNGSSKRSLFF